MSCSLNGLALFNVHGEKYLEPSNRHRNLSF